MLSGCSSSDYSKIDTYALSPQGRFIEETLEPPITSTEMPINAYYKDNQLFLYTYIKTSKEAEYNLYIYNGLEWSKSKEYIETDNAISISQIKQFFYGQDNNIYVVCNSSNRNCILKKTNNKWIDVTPDEVTDITDISDCEILTDGGFCITDTFSKQVLLTGDKTMLTLNKFSDAQTDFSNTTCISPSKLAIKYSTGQVDFIDSKNFSIVNTKTLPWSNAILAYGYDTFWYALSDSGILRFSEDGDIIEIIADENIFHDEHDGNKTISFFCGNNTDFYALYGGDSQKNMYLVHYYFDKNIPTNG